MGDSISMRKRPKETSEQEDSRPLGGEHRPLFRGAEEYETEPD